MANEFIPVNLSELENFAPVNLKQMGIRDYSDIKRQEVALAAAQKKQQLDPNRLPDTIEEYKLLFPTATPEQLQNYVYTKQEQAKQRQIDEVHQQGVFKDTSAMDYPVSFASGVIETASVIPLLGDMALRAATAGNYSLDELLEDTTGLPQNSSIKKDLQSALHDQLSEKAQLEDQEKQLKNELFNIRRDQRLQMSADEGYGDLHANAAEFMAEVKDSLINIGEAGPESVAREVAKNLPNLLAAQLTAMKGAALTKTAVEKAVTHKLAAKYGDEAAEKIKKGTERFMASKAGIGKVQTGATAGAIASMMAMEGSSNAQEAGQQIREMPSVELRATKGYQEMQKANPKMSEDDIRLALANKAEEVTLAAAGTSAAIPATLMGGFLGRTAAAPISKATIGSAVKGTLEGGVRETLEETGQGFSGGVSKNFAEEKVLNRKDFSEMSAKELLAGVGRETAESAVAGFGAGATFAGTVHGGKYLANKAGQAKDKIDDFQEQRTANKILTENSPAQKARMMEQEYTKSHKGNKDNVEAQVKSRQEFVDKIQPVMDQFDTELATREQALQTAQETQKQWEDKLATLNKDKQPDEFREASRAVKRGKNTIREATEALEYVTATQNRTRKLYEGIQATEIKDNTGLDVNTNPEQVILADNATPAMKKLAIQKILGIKTFGTHGTNEEKAAQQKLLNDMLDNPDIANDEGIKQRISSKLKLIQYYEDIQNGAAPDMTDTNQDTVAQDILVGNERNKFLGVNEYILDIRGAIASKNKQVGNKLMRGLVNLRMSRDIKVDLASKIHAIAQNSPDDATFEQNAGELIKQYQARFPGANGQLFNIHRNTFNTLLPKMQTERDLIVKAENELQQEAKAVFKMPLAAQAYSGTQRRFTPGEDTAESKQAQAEAQQAPVNQEEVPVEEQEEAPVYDNYNPVDENEAAPEETKEESKKDKAVFEENSGVVKYIKNEFNSRESDKSFLEKMKQRAAGQTSWTDELRDAFVNRAKEMVEEESFRGILGGMYIVEEMGNKTKKEFLAEAAAYSDRQHNWNSSKKTHFSQVASKVFDEMREDAKQDSGETVEETPDVTTEKVVEEQVQKEVTPTASEATAEAKQEDVTNADSTELQKIVNENTDSAVHTRNVAIVQKLFYQLPELKNIGTVDEYIQFVKEIYPSSLIKKILFHGSPKIFTKFDKSKLNTNFGYVTDAVYTLPTGEKIPSDSSLAMFLTESEANASTYALLGYIQQIETEGGALKRLHTYLRTGNSISEDAIEVLRNANKYNEWLALTKESVTPEQLKMLDKQQQIISEQQDSAKQLLNKFDYIERNTNKLNLYSTQSFINSLREASINKNPVLGKSALLVIGTTEFSDVELTWNSDKGYVFSTYNPISKMYDSFAITSLSNDEIQTFFNKAHNSIKSTKQQLKKSISELAIPLKRYPVIINITNPNILDYKGSGFQQKFKGNPNKYKKSVWTKIVSSEQTLDALNNGNDGVIFKNIVDPVETNNYGVFDVENITILGTPENLQEFSKWKKLQQVQPNETPIQEQTEESVKSESVIPETEDSVTDYGKVKLFTGEAPKNIKDVTLSQAKKLLKKLSNSRLFKQLGINLVYKINKKYPHKGRINTSSMEQETIDWVLTKVFPDLREDTARNGFYNLSKLQEILGPELSAEYANELNKISRANGKHTANLLLSHNERYSSQKEFLRDVLEVLRMSAADREGVIARLVWLSSAEEDGGSTLVQYVWHYLDMFKDSPLVERALKDYGFNPNKANSLDAALDRLANDITKQAIAQKGKAYNTWKGIVNWMVDLLSNAEVKQILTDSFIKQRSLGSRGSFKYKDSTEVTKPELVKYLSQSSLKSLWMEFPKVFPNLPKMSSELISTIGKNIPARLVTPTVFETTHAGPLHKTVNGTVVINVDAINSVEDMNRIGVLVAKALLTNAMTTVDAATLESVRKALTPYFDKYATTVKGTNPKQDLVTLFLKTMFDEDTRYLANIAHNSEVEELVDTLLAERIPKTHGFLNRLKKKKSDYNYLMASAMSLIPLGKGVKVKPDSIKFGLGNALRSLMKTFSPKGELANTDSLRVSEIEIADLAQDQQEFLTGVQSFTKRFGDTFIEYIKPLSTGKNLIKNAVNYQPTSLFVDESGQFHPWFAEAVGLAAYEWLAISGPSTLENTLGDIRINLGKSKDAYLTPQEMAEQRFIGSQAEQVSERIGLRVLRNLGITFNTDTAAYQYHKDMARHIGEAALIVLSKTPINEQSTQPAVTIDKTKAKNIYGEDGRTVVRVEGVTMRFVRANSLGAEAEGTPDAELDKLNKDIHTHMDLFESLTEQEMELTARSKPVKPYTEIDLGFRKASKKAVATINALNNSPYYIQQEMFKLYSVINESDVNDMIGIDNRPESKIHADKRKGVRSRNLGIQRVRDKLAVQIESMRTNDKRWADGTDSPIYLNHTISSNDRFFVDSPLNPQTSKIIRQLLTKKERMSTIDISNSDNNDLNLFKFAVLEAFGEKVNKLTPTRVREKFDELLASPDTQEAIQEVRKALEDGATNVAAPTLARLSKSKENLWTTSAVLALSKYQTAVQSGATSFETDLYIQFDGTTNGYFFSIFLMALGKQRKGDRYETDNEAIHRIKEMAQKVGVFTKDSPYKTVNDYKQVPGNEDIYEERAKMFIDAIREMYADKPGVAEAIEQLFSPFDKPWMDANGTTSSGRNLVKNAVTQLIYGAGPEGIALTIKGDAIDTLLDKFEQIASGEVDVSKKQEILEQLRVLAKLAPEVNSESLLTELAKANGDALLEMSLIPYEHLFATIFNHMRVDKETTPNVGGAVEQLIERQNPVMKANKDWMVGAVKKIFANFAEKMQESINAAALDENGKTDPSRITEDKLMEIYNQHAAIAPIFHTANSEDISEGYSLVEFNKLNPTGDSVDEESGSVFEPNKGWKLLISFSKNETRVVLHDGKTFDEGETGKGNKITPTDEWTHGLKPIVIKLPSVSIAPGLTISSDAATISTPLIEKAILGLHDAVSMGINQASETGNLINDSAIEVITNYSSLESVLNRFKEIYSEEIDAFYNDPEVKKDMEKGYLSISTALRNRLPIGVQYHLGKQKVDMLKRLKGVFVPAIQYSSQYNPHIESGSHINESATDLPTAIPVNTGNTKGSSQEGVDESLFTNSVEQTIDHNNAIDVFDGLANEGNVVETAAHSSYLRSLISQIYLGSMGVLQMATETFGDTTKAVINLADKKIRMQLASKATMNTMMMGGIRMSAQQAYTHELTHNHMAHAIDNDTAVARQARLLFKKAEENVTWEDFITPGVTPTAEEITMAKNTYDYIFRNEASIKESSMYLYQLSQNERNAYLHEFAAFGLTNENFIRKLKTIKLTRKDLVSDKVGATNKNVFTVLAEMITEHFNRLRLKLKGESLDATTDVHAELYRLARELSETNEKHGFKVFEKIKEANEFTAKYTKAMAAAVWENDSKTVTAMKRGLEEYLLKTDEIEEFYRVTMNEITGSKPAHQVYEWIARINSKNLEQKPIHQSKHIAEVIEKQFAEGVLTEQTRRAIHRALVVPDLSSLMITGKDVMDKHFTWTKIKEILTAAKALDSEIAAIEAEIRKVANAHESNFIEAQVQSLGAFLATGMTTEQYTLRSLESIVSAHPALLETASRLVSLQTLKYTDQQSKEILAGMIDTSQEALEFTINTHAALKAVALKRAPDNSKFRLKGALQDTLNHYKDVQVFSTATETPVKIQEKINRLTKLNYVKIREDKISFTNHKGESEVTTVQVYGSPFNPRSTFDTGAVAYRNPDKTNKDYVGSVNIRQEINAQRANGKKNSVPKHHTIADNRGNIATAHLMYSVSEETLRTNLDKQENFSRTLGQLGAVVSSEITTVKANRFLSKEWAKEIKENMAKESGKYLVIPVGEDATPSTIPLYKKVQKEYMLLPPHLKAAMLEDGIVDDNGNLTIHREAIKLLFAQSRLSPLNLEYKQKDIDEDRATEYMGKLVNNALYHLLYNKPGMYAFRGWEETVSFAKGTIVIKGMEVLIHNIISNNISLVLLDVGFKDLMKWQHEGYYYAKEYQFLKKQVTQMELEMKMDTKKNTKEARIQLSRLKNRIASNPTRELFELGAFSAISEEIYTLNEDSPFKGLMEEQIEKITEHNPLNEKMTKAFKIATLQRGTIGYQALMDLTQMSDFVARYVLWKHLTERKGMKKEQAIQEVMDTFVMYDTVTNKWIQLGNDIGLIMFTKFWLRTQRVIKKVAVENPVYLALYLFSQYMFFDTTDILDSFLFNMPEVNTPWGVVSAVVTEQPLVKLLF